MSILWNIDFKKGDGLWAILKCWRYEV